jgi:hypothetical protein
MPTYTVIAQADQTFRVAIVGDDGARQTLLGFPTQADAEARFAGDRRRSAVDAAADAGRSSDAAGSLIATKVFARAAAVSRLLIWFTERRSRHDS